MLYKLIYVVVCVLALFLLLPPVREYSTLQVFVRPIYLLSLAAALTYIITPIVRKTAIKFKSMDVPDPRKVHIEPTPRWGGLAIYFAFAFVTLYNFDFSLAQKGVAIGGTMLVLVGMIDDRYGVSTKLRLLVQLAACIVAIYTGAKITFLPNTWWGNALEYVITVIWLIGITNAMNFLDGMDGLCAGLAAVNSFFFGAVAVRTGQPFFMFLSAALCGACIGFLPYNFRKNKPALIFLGDTGSTFLGFTLAGIALTGDWAVDNSVALVVPITILAIPIFDMTLTTIMRIRAGQVHNVSEWLHFTGKDHFHHRLADMGFGKRRTVQLIHLIAICLGINGFILYWVRLVDAALIIIETAILFLMLGYLMVFVKRQYNYWANLVSEVAGMTEPIKPMDD
ncbi:undecaprenyl/decaprenyl-phosphate alpha-N-acetylglucosaminyl 1-phosphate transferase [bacterium]|nr:undecaprenyl/decaprenyl-phosphate alpha-N-acetylglucosaminyl 1-phosphate transferase [FCB group bacterium]MBL7190501.1 undecaprenyl/decaprenyl-phosphate alpha-N-acetylglucosaminyl 1-phosphate transferase [bacterium]